MKRWQRRADLREIVRRTGLGFLPIVVLVCAPRHRLTKRGLQLVFEPPAV